MSGYKKSGSDIDNKFNIANSSASINELYKVAGSSAVGRYSSTKSGATSSGFKVDGKDLIELINEEEIEEWNIIYKSPSSGFRYADIACSSDANYIYVTTLGPMYNTNCEVYRSDDGGSTWTTVLGPNASPATPGVYTSVACSDNGQYVYVSNSNGTSPHKYSTNYGVTWSNVPTVTPTRFTRFIAMSADGNYIVTGYENMDSRFGEKGIWTYRNGTWSLKLNNNYKNFVNGAVSSNGQYALVFSPRRAGPSGYSRGDYSSTYGVYVSSDYMDNWSQKTQINSSTYDAGCAISANGQYMAVAVIEGVYISTDYGSNWTLKLSMANTSLGAASQNSNRPQDIAMSSDGMIMVLTTWEGYTYKSINRGENWVVDNEVVRRWISADITPDGNKIVMCANPSSLGNGNGGFLHKFIAQQSQDSLLLDPYWMARQPSGTNTSFSDERFYNSMLSSGHSWIPPNTNIGHYITIDLGNTYSVSGFATKGREGNAQHVTKYKISYSINNTNFNFIKDSNNNDIEFIGNNSGQYQSNNDGSSYWTLSSQYLTNTISARYVRFYPIEHSSYPSLRCGVYVKTSMTFEIYDPPSSKRTHSLRYTNPGSSTSTSSVDSTLSGNKYWWVEWNVGDNQTNWYATIDLRDNNNNGRDIAGIRFAKGIGLETQNLSSYGYNFTIEKSAPPQEFYIEYSTNGGSSYSNILNTNSVLNSYAKSITTNTTGEYGRFYPYIDLHPPGSGYGKPTTVAWNLDEIDFYFPLGTVSNVTHIKLWPKRHFGNVHYAFRFGFIVPSQ